MGGAFQSLWGKREETGAAEAEPPPMKLGLSGGLTGTCTQLWGHAGPDWTSFLSSQRLEPQAEVCREPGDRDQTQELRTDRTLLGPEDRIRRT